MNLLFVALALYLLGAFGSLAASRSSRWARRVGTSAALAGALTGLLPAIQVALGAHAEAVRLDWQVPYGSFYVELDALSAFFLLPILGISALAAVYGGAYLESYRGRRSMG